ncbi:hypothetical protein AGLY_009444 [Aphis glycines]|uniref:Uncharacterized protein n=1 Tax=Aphis glycines TaxID=307491 RepID=A0A6G0THG6_APHGL|nr:hypothetical protein AGLY_009444 [Aphis glycines]
MDYSKAFVFLTLIAGQMVIEGNGNSYKGTWVSLTASCFLEHFSKMFAINKRLSQTANGTTLINIINTSDLNIINSHHKIDIFKTFTFIDIHKKTPNKKLKKKNIEVFEEQKEKKKQNDNMENVLNSRQPLSILIKIIESNSEQLKMILEEAKAITTVLVIIVQKCKTKRCKFKVAEVLCISKYHNGNMFQNKQVIYSKM